MVGSSVSGDWVSGASVSRASVVGSSVSGSSVSGTSVVGSSVSGVSVVGSSVTTACANAAFTAVITPSEEQVAPPTISTSAEFASVILEIRPGLLPLPFNALLA